MSVKTTPRPVRPQGAPVRSIRLMIAEREELTRGALVTVLGMETGIDVVAAVGDGDALTSTVASVAPDVLIVDAALPGVDGLTVSRELLRRLPRLRIIVCSRHDRPGYPVRAVAAGAHGFVLKSISPRALVDTIHRVGLGLRVIDPALVARSRLHGHSILTPRETEVMAATLTGARPADIAALMRLSRGTIRNHQWAAREKLGARSSMEAARIAEERGWL